MKKLLFFIPLLLSLNIRAQVPAYVDQINREAIIPNFKETVREELVDMISRFYEGRFGYVRERQEGYTTEATLYFGRFLDEQGKPLGDSTIRNKVFNRLLYIVHGQRFSDGIVFGGNRYSVDFAYALDDDGELMLKFWIAFSIRDSPSTNFTVDLIAVAGNFEKCMDYKVRIEYFDPFGRPMSPLQELPMEFVNVEKDQVGYFDFMSLSIPIPSGEKTYTLIDTSFTMDEWGEPQKDENGIPLYEFSISTLVSNLVSVKVEIWTSCEDVYLYQNVTPIVLRPNQEIRILRAAY